MSRHSQRRRRTCLGIAKGDDGTAGYAIRMSGAVGGALSDGRPYPYMTLFHQLEEFVFRDELLKLKFVFFRYDK